jgi:DNA-binding NarL/FixJ family response regulator
VSDERERIRVLLAAHHALFREALRRGLESYEDLVVVGEARDSQDAVEEAKRTVPHVAILDLLLPITATEPAPALIKEIVPRCRVLVLGTDEDLQLLIHILDQGASGYLTREAPLAELVAAIRTLHHGDALIPPRLLGPLLTNLLTRRRERSRAAAHVATLTPREREVLALLTEGADNERIARELVISPQTARTHIQNIFGKLSVHSRLEAAAFVTQNGVLPELVGADD